MLILAIFCFEVLFVGLVDRHDEILMMGYLYCGFAAYVYLVKIIQVNIIVSCGIAVSLIHFAVLTKSRK